MNTPRLRRPRVSAVLAWGALVLSLAYVALLAPAGTAQADPAASPVVTISVGGNPRAAAVSDTTIYVPNLADGTVTVIDRASATVTSTLNVGAAPTGAVLVGKHVYVPLDQGNAIAVINIAKSTLQGTIAVGSHPGLPVISADGRTALVSNSGDATVSVIDTTSRVVTATIPVGGSPMRAAFGTGSQGQSYASKAFVPNSADGTVSIIDLGSNTVVATTKVTGPLSDAVASPALSTAGYSVFIASKQGGSTSVVSIDQATGRIARTSPLDGDDVPQVPVVLADGSAFVDPSGGFLQVQQMSKNYLGPETDVAAFTQGSVGAGALSPDGAWALFSSPKQQFFASAPYVSLMNTATMSVVAMIRVGNQPESLAFAPSGNLAVVSNAADSTVSVIDLSQSFWPSAPRSVKLKEVSKRNRPMTATLTWKQPSSAGPQGITDVYVAPSDTSKYCVSAKNACSIKNLSASKGYIYALRARSPLAIGAGTTVASRLR